MEKPRNAAQALAFSFGLGPHARRRLRGARRMNPILAFWLSVVALYLAAIAAWFTHVIVCITTGAWLFLIAGALAFPVGMIHGVGIWLRLW